MLYYVYGIIGFVSIIGIYLGSSKPKNLINHSEQINRTNQIEQIKQTKYSTSSKLLNNSTSICTNNLKKINNLKNQYKIMSTENTKQNTYYIFSIPINTNINILYEQNKLDINQLVKNTFLENKRLFHKIFFKNSICLINGLFDFQNFQINNLINNKYISSKYNILLKFSNKSNEYLYISVKGYDMIKIIKYYEYDNICNKIENDKIFIMKNQENHEMKEYYIIHGNFITETINSDTIKKIFFNNRIKTYNYEILKKFDNIKIYYYVCTKI